ncbi:MAG: aminotransferase class V-fold PLP-dependent enzyme [Ruminococcaceae bacterium]|nr:aminotransferase class V-fold PLP-dependent enzyme [Oscillospiraceae bacterium]
MIYFDNAATSFPKPECVISATTRALRENSANPGRSGHKLSVDTAEKIYSARQAVANFFSCSDAENVIFTQNCTHSLNAVIKGFLKKGDHVLTSNLEHNAVMRPLYSLAEKGLITFDTFEASLLSDELTVENFKSKINSKTRLCVCTNASNVTGQVLPVREIGRFCKQQGIAFCIDAAQTAGRGKINIKEDNADFVCIAPHKSLFAPMGIGVLIALAPLDNVLIEGGTGGNSASKFVPEFYPERLESGTVNVPAILGLEAGLKFLKKLNPQKLYENEMSVLKRIYLGLYNNENIELYTPFPKMGKFMPVLPFNFRGVHSEKTSAALNSFGIATRAGLHCAPSAHSVLNTLETGAVRVSVGAFNTPRQADYLVSVINSEKFMKKLQDFH